MISPALLADPQAGAPPVRVCEDVDPGRWDAYVEGQAEASAYHRYEWCRLIGRAFGHTARPLAAVRGDRVVGVLPLVVMRSRLFGTFVVSLPFLNAGGVLADDESTAGALLDAAVRIANDSRAEYLELRHAVRRFPGLGERRHRVAMTLALQATPEQQWLALDRKIRNQVRKAEKSNLTATIGGSELVPSFYGVFTRNMRDLGTPVFGRVLFEEVLRSFPERSRVVCVYRGEQAVAASIVHWRGGWMEVPWASALREFNSVSANVFLYWQMLQLAIASGCRTFDFGRCAPDEGTFQFKKQWGAEPSPLVWEYWTASGVVNFDASPSNPRYARAVDVWRRLPLSVTSILGPRIVRGIPC